MSSRRRDYERRIRLFAHQDPEGMAEMFLSLHDNLLRPADGWYTFGHHIAGGDLEFWGTGVDGNPLWEKPIKEYV